MTKIHQLFLFLINPLLGLSYSFILMLRKSSNFSPIIIASSISLIFVYLPLMYDTSSNYYRTYLITYRQFYEPKVYNLIAYYLNYYFDVQYMTVVLIYTIFILFIWFSIFNYFKKITILSTQDYYFMLAFVFLIVIYRNIMDLNRFYLAISIILFLLYYIEKNKNINKLLFFTISSMAVIIHPGTIPLVLLLYIVYFINLSYMFFLLLPFVSLVFALFSYQILDFIMNQFASLFFSPHTLALYQNYASVNSQWGAGHIRKALIYIRYIEVFLMLLFYYIGLKLLKENIDTSIGIKFTLIFFPIVIVVLPFLTMYERYSIAFFVFSSFIFYHYIVQKKYKSFVALTVISLLLVRFLFINLFLYGNIFTSEYNNIILDENKKIELMLKPLYYPTPLLLWIEVNGYSDEVIAKISVRGKEELR